MNKTNKDLFFRTQTSSPIQARRKDSRYFNKVSQKIFDNNGKVVEDAAEACFALGINAIDIIPKQISDFA